MLSCIHKRLSTGCCSRGHQSHDVMLQRRNASHPGRAAYCQLLNHERQLVLSNRMQSNSVRGIQQQTAEASGNDSGRVTSDPGPQSSTSGRPGGHEEAFITFEEVQKIAERRGLSITLKTLGPFYRIVCRENKSVSSSSSNGSSSSSDSSSGGGMSQHQSSSNGSGTGSSARGQRLVALQQQQQQQWQGEEAGQKILAVTTGFVAPPPFALMHCDTLQVFTRGLSGDEGHRIRGGPLGLGLLLGGATFSFALSCGCTKAEILAINDDDAWHERLVRYYSYFGFKPVRKVGGNGLGDIPHMVVWGGAGTRMDADVRAMLRKWSVALRRTLKDEQHTK